MNHMSKIAWLAAALWCATLANAAADKLNDITKAGTVRIAVLQDYPPFASVGPDMQIVGLDIDVAKLIAEKLGVKAELVPSTGPNRIPYLQTGKVDIIVASLGRNAEREKIIDFVAPYNLDANAVFGPPDIKVSSLSDLVGKSVAVVRGATEDLAFSKMAPEGTIIKRFEDNNGIQSAYLSGQVNLIVTSDTVAGLLGKGSPGQFQMKLRVSEGDQRAYVGLPKDEQALKDKIEQIVSSARKDGTLSRITIKWIGADLPPDL